MADHVRQQIRERIATTITGLTTTGSNVYQSRVYPLDSVSLPALLVYTLSEGAEVDTMGTSLGLNRTLSVAIEGYVKVNTDFDDVVDDICKEVEAALGADRALNNLAKSQNITSTEIQFNGEGDQPVGVVTMTYTVVYRTTTTAPDIAI
jgi:hypothetical protein